MKVRYILMYGTPYLKHEYFETFDDMSKFLVRKLIVNYRIYEIMGDAKEVEMIHLENDVKVLETENQQLIQRIEYLERSIARKEETIDDKQNEIVSLDTTVKKIKHILNNQMDYREFVDMINAIEDVLKESDVK